MTLLLTRAALWRRPISLACTAIVVAMCAALAGAPAPLALSAWILCGLLALAGWHAVERFVLCRRGWRAPSRLERERLDLVPACAGVDILVIDRPQPWLGSGLRCVLISRGLLDLLEDRALGAVLSQAAAGVPSAGVAGELLVWLGNLPLVGGWWFARGIVRLGQLLAVVIGGALVLPLLVWPAGVAGWGGRLLGAMGIGLLGSALLSSGLAAPGLDLLLAWAVVPGLLWLLDGESRRAQLGSDQAMVDAGLGWQLLEALETLGWAEAMPAPDPLLSLICRTSTPLVERSDRIWRALSHR